MSYSYNPETVISDLELIAKALDNNNCHASAKHTREIIAALHTNLAVTERRALAAPVEPVATEPETVRWEYEVIADFCGREIVNALGEGWEFAAPPFGLRCDTGEVMTAFLRRRRPAAESAGAGDAAELTALRERAGELEAERDALKSALEDLASQVAPERSADSKRWHICRLCGQEGLEIQHLGGCEWANAQHALGNAAATGGHADA